MARTFNFDPDFLYNITNLNNRLNEYYPHVKFALAEDAREKPMDEIEEEDIVFFIEWNDPPMTCEDARELLGRLEAEDPDGLLNF